MIGKLFPRILNKSSDKSAIKPSEFTDAINILVSSDDGGDGNVIKKIDGTIAAVIEDPSNFPFTPDGSSGSNTSEVVIGHLVDEGKKRVYYFACSNDSNTSSIYLAKESSDGDGVVFMCLLRDSELNFSEEDFVASNVIRIPKKNIDSGLDSDVSGEMGDENPGFDDFNFGEDVSSLQLGLEPQPLEDILITGAEWVDPDSQGVSGDIVITFQNLGTQPAIVNLFAQVSSVSVPSLNVSATPLNPTVTVPALSNAFQVFFSVTLDVPAASAGLVENTQGNVIASVETGFQQVDNGTLASAPISGQFVTDVTFIPPTLIYPDSAELTYNGVPQSVLNTPAGTSAVTLSNQPVPENEFWSVQGPFTITFNGGDPDIYEYRNPIKISAVLTNGFTSNQNPSDHYYFGGFHQNQSNVSLINPATTPQSQNSPILGGEVTLQPTDNISNSSFTFWLVKAYDTTDWIANNPSGLSDPALLFMECKITFLDMVPFSGSFAPLGLSFNGGQPNQVELGHLCAVQDVQTPASLSVQNFTPTVASTGEIILPSHIEAGNNSNNGGTLDVKYEVHNTGETEGFFQALLDQNLYVYSDVFSDWPNIFNSPSPADAVAALDSAPNNTGFNKGGYNLIRVDVEDSNGVPIASNMSPRSETVLDLPVANGTTIRGNTDQTYLDYLDTSSGATEGEAVSIFPVPPGDFVTVKYKFNNTDQDFQYGVSDVVPVGDIDEITEPTSFPSGPYRSYGKNLFAPVVYTFKVRTGNGNSLADMVNTPFAQNANLIIDEDLVGQLKIFANSKRATSHPFSGNFGQILNSSGLGGYDPVTNPNPMVSAYGQNVGEPYILAGKYPITSASDTTSTVSLITSLQNGALDWLSTYMAASSNVPPAPEDFVEIIFYNSGSYQNGGTVTVNLKSNTNLEWFNAYEDIGASATSPWDVAQLIPFLSLVDSDIWKSGNNLNSGYISENPVGTANSGTNTGLMPGSLGTAWLVSAPELIDDVEYEQNGFPPSPASIFGPGSIASTWDPDPTNGAYDYDASAVGGSPGDEFYGGWRSVSFNVPPGTFVRARLFAGFSSNGANPNPGLEDFLNNTSFGNIPDYTNPKNVFGLPVAISATWTGDVTNQQPSEVGICGAVLVPTDQQYTTITN